MSDLVYLVLASYLGEFAGIIISFMAREELEKGRKYFYLIKYLVFSIICFFFFKTLFSMAYSTLISTLISASISLLIFIISLIEKKIKYGDYLFFTFLAIILYELKTPLIATLIFIFGIAYSSIKISEINNIEKIEFNQTKKVIRKIGSIDFLKKGFFIINESFIFLIISIFLLMIKI